MERFDHTLLTDHKGTQIVCDIAAVEAQDLKEAKTKLRDLGCGMIHAYVRSDSEGAFWVERDKRDESTRRTIELVPTTEVISNEKFSPLTELFSEPEMPMIISLVSNEFRIQHSVSAYFDKHKIDSGSLIVRPLFTIVTKALKKVRPMWAYASAKPTFTRLLALHTLYWEGLAPMPADLINVEPKVSQRWVLDDRLVDEIRRRNKWSLATKVETIDDVKRLKEMKISFILISDPKLLSASL